MHGAKKQFGRSMERMHKEIWLWDQPEQEKVRKLGEVNIINPDGYEPEKKANDIWTPHAGRLVNEGSCDMVTAKGSSQGVVSD